MREGFRDFEEILFLGDPIENESRALVLWVSNKSLKVLINGTEHELKLPGRWRRATTGQRPVAPGDWLSVNIDGDSVSLTGLLKRRNEFTRKMAGQLPLPQVVAANLDQVMVMASIESPRTSFGLIDRLLVTASIGNVPSCIMINKCDLASPERLQQFKDNYTPARIPLIFTSVKTGMGIDEILLLLKGRTTLLAGQSGAGKTSLANLIQPGLDLRTEEISEATGKGKHVTSSSKLHALHFGGWLIDTPGLRECSPWGLNREKLMESFPELEEFGSSCRFRNCKHASEPGCGVRAAVENNQISTHRYDSFLKLLSEYDIKTSY